MTDEALEARWRSIVDAPPLFPVPYSLEASNSLKERAQRVVPSCSQTFSKAPFQFVQGVAPTFLQGGKGCRVWDVDGNTYLDWAMALCAMTLGYADEDVDTALIRQIREGSLFTLPHPLETQVSERLVELIPCAEMVRFGKNGSDATSGAVRLARAHTRRDVIACCGYHGWQDWYVGNTTRNRGVPDAVARLTESFVYNDLDGLRDIFAKHPDDVAAVIMEPTGVVEPLPGFLEEVRELCHTHGALLIFDEIITGFRLSMGGAQEYFGVTPDLGCFGKGMANGFSVSALTGRKDVMELGGLDHDKPRTFLLSATHGGETHALAAARATIDFVEEHDVPAHIWQIGRSLVEGYRGIVAELDLDDRCKVIGEFCSPAMIFHDTQGDTDWDLRTLFLQEMVRHGILIPYVSIAWAHKSEHVERTLAAARESLVVCQQAVEKGSCDGLLEGPATKPVFRRFN